MAKEQTNKKASNVDSGLQVGAMRMDESMDSFTTWKGWFQKFSLFLVASGHEESTDRRKVALLLHFIGDRGVDIFNSFGIESDNVSYETVVTKFVEHFTPQKNVTMERYKFFSRKQIEGESFTDFITDLQNLSLSCEFENMREDLIRDIIIIGIRDNKMKEFLLRETKLTLSKALSICKTLELSKKQIEEINKKDSEIEVLSINKRSCYTCGGNWSPSHQCPAKGATCKKCKKKNHFAKVCRTVKKVAAVGEEQVPDEEHEQNFFIGNISSKSSNEWLETLIINGLHQQFKLDSGAQVNCMSLSTFKSLHLDEKHIEKSKIKLSSVNDSLIKVYGTCNIKCQLLNGKTDNILFVIIKSKSLPILGLKTCINLKLLSRIQVNKICSVENIPENTQSILENHQHTFEGIGCFDQIYHIKLQANAVPRADPPRRIPIALREPLKQELENMVKQDIIEKVMEPAEWINSIVITKRKNNKLRVCIDPRYLNSFIVRQHRQLPTIDDIIDTLNGAKYFTKLDCNSGFWTVKLDKASSYLCTFATPYGNFRFKRLPFGLCTSTEAFQERMEMAFKNIKGVQFYVDDLILYSNTIEEHMKLLKQVLEIADIHNIKFNKEKSEFLTTEVKFLGLIINQHGIKPDPEKVNAITMIETIKDKKDLQRFLGMTNYLSKFIPHYSTITAPLRELLKNDILFQWNLSHDKAFNQLKQCLTESPLLQIFNVNKDIVMSVDCSSEGVGACLLQDQKPIAYASKALSNCQKSYAQVEKEMFAIVFGCHKFHKYILGKQITVESDHSALQILFKKPLCKVPSRIQRMMLKIQGYDLNVKYVPGNKMFISDFLSRSFLPDNRINEETKFDQELNSEVICHVEITMNNLPISEEKKNLIKIKTQEDPTLLILTKYINNGWPKHKKDVHLALVPFWPFKNDLNIIDGLIFKESLLLIPNSLQKHMLEIIHEGHFGFQTCWRRAKSIIFWPGLKNKILEMCNSCHTCSIFRQNNSKESIMFHSVPNLPWLKLGTDLFDFNKNTYLLVVDYYSKFIEIAKLENLSATCVINHIKSIIARHGVPLEIVSDNGPQYFCEEFKQFTKSYSIKHTTSSPYYPKSNGLAEASVKIIKNILKKCHHENKDPYLALLNYRNTPKEGSPSPANLLFNRNLNDMYPVSTSYLQPRVSKRNDKVDNSKQKTIQNYYNRNATELKELQVGDNILFKKHPEDKIWIRGKVLSKLVNPRSYNIQTKEGRVFRRNRQHIRISYNKEENNNTNKDNSLGLSPAASMETFYDNFNDFDNNFELDDENHELLQDATDDTNITTKDISNNVSYKTRSGRTVKIPARYL